MISKFFIERPVLANVLAILMVLIGAVALYALPVAQYPDVVPPTVQVTTRYPGASASTVIDTVALPIEQQVNGVEDMLYMQSTQRQRRQLHADRHLRDRHRPQLRAGPGAEPGRRARCRRCRRRCRRRASRCRRSRPSILQIVTLTSPDGRYDSLYLANYATISLQGRDRRACPASATSTCSAPASIRCASGSIPNKMQARGLTPQDVIQALQQQSEQVTAGQIGMPPAPAGQTFQYTLNVAGRLDDADAVRRRHRQDRQRRRRSRACATSAASSSARRPMARSSRSTASRRRASPSSSRRAPTRSTSRGEVRGEDGGAGGAISRRASSTTSRSTPPTSSTSRSTRSTRR